MKEIPMNNPIGVLAIIAVPLMGLILIVMALINRGYIRFTNLNKMPMGSKAIELFGIDWFVSNKILAITIINFRVLFGKGLN